MTAADHDIAGFRYASNIADLLGLRDNWDGEGATAPSKALIDFLKAFVFECCHSKGLSFPTRIAPTLDGALVAEWQSPGGDYLSAEIETPGNIEWMHARGGAYRHWTETLPFRDC